MIENKEYYTEELEKLPKEKMEALKYQKILYCWGDHLNVCRISFYVFPSKLILQLLYLA